MEIPASWTGRRIWLKIGGVRSQGWFWVNGEQVAWVDNYCGTYKYEITSFVKPGEKAVVVAQVNKALGWWWMGTQVGTAFRRDDPALGELPHEGFLSPLTFEIIKMTAKKLPFAGLDEHDISVVGEGGDACYLYLGAAKIARGRALMAFGLDVLSGTPEGTCILDGMIETVRSPAFNPKGTVVME